MEEIISKSRFRPRALYYFREVEKTGKELIISDRGKPVLKITRYRHRKINSDLTYVKPSP